MDLFLHRESLAKPLSLNKFNYIKKMCLRRGVDELMCCKCNYLVPHGFMRSLELQFYVKINLHTRSKKLLGVQKNGNRAVIEQAYLHHGLETTGGYRGTQGS